MSAPAPLSINAPSLGEMQMRETAAAVLPPHPTPLRLTGRSGSIAALDATPRSSTAIDPQLKNALFTLKISRPAKPLHGAHVALKYVYYSRQTLLARILASALQKHAPPLPFARSVFEAQSRVTYTDLRVIDPSMDMARKPTITLRHKCLIVSIMPIHAVILPDTAYIFPQPGADSDLQPILEAMESWSYTPSAHVLSLLGPMPPLLRAMPSMARLTDGLNSALLRRHGSLPGAPAPSPKRLLQLNAATAENNTAATPAPAMLGSIAEGDASEMETETAADGGSADASTPTLTVDIDVDVDDDAARPSSPLSDEIEGALRRWNARVDTLMENMHVIADFQTQFVHGVVRAVLQAAELGLAADLKEMTASVTRNVGKGVKSTPDVLFEEIQHTRSVCTEIVDRLERAIRATETMQETEEPAYIVNAPTSAARSSDSARDGTGGTSTSGSGAAGGGSAAPRVSAGASASASAVATATNGEDDVLSTAASTGAAFDAKTDVAMAKALDIADEMFDDFAINAAHILSDARLELQRLDVERKRLNLSMASTRNLMLRVQILLQLITTCLAFCSALSGYFGMNLDNGGCGPDGCHDGDANDHGYRRFVFITTISTSIAATIGFVAYRTIDRTISRR